MNDIDPPAARVLSYAQYAMFNGASSFDRDLSRWNIRHVQLGTAPMRHMFRDSGVSDCNKHRMNEAFLARNAKWPYNETWSELPHC